jgi:hypothetical protein
MARKVASTGIGGRQANVNKHGYLECNVHPRHGGGWRFETQEELVTIAAAATTDSTIAFPAHSIGLGVTAYVKTAFDTATNTDIGVSGTATRYLTNLADTAGTADFGGSVDFYAAATVLLFTPDATPTVADGRVYVQIHYLVFDPITSVPEE